MISGISFLGAGVIMKEGMNVRGLNTAATLWCSAAVGAFAGGDMPLEALFVTLAVLACNTLLRPLVNAINRVPIDESAWEATYEVQVTTGPEEVGPARDLLVERLEAANDPVGSIEVVERGECHRDFDRDCRRSRRPRCRDRRSCPCAQHSPCDVARPNRRLRFR